MLTLLPPFAFAAFLGTLLLAGAASDATETLLGGRFGVQVASVLLIVGGASAFAFTSRRADGIWRSPWGHRALAIALTGVLFYIAMTQVAELDRIATRKTDFATIYAAATAMRVGESPYDVGSDDYFYPPVLAVLAIPLTAIPIGWASIVWLGLKLWLLADVMRRIASMAPLQAYARSTWGWVLLGILLCSARFWMADLQFGNTNILILALVVAGLNLELRGRQRLAGAALGTAAILKVTPVLVLVWLLGRRSWRTIAWGALVIGALALVPSLSPTGLSAAWTEYWEHGVRGKLGANLSEPDNQSLLGALSRMRLGATVLWTSWVLGCAALALLVAYAGARTRRASRDAALVAASLCPLLLLAASPGSWVVHYVLAMLPLAVALVYAHGSLRARPILAAFWLANVAFTASGWFRASVRPSLEQSWFVLALLVLFASLLWLALRLARVPNAVD